MKPKKKQNNQRALSFTENSVEKNVLLSKDDFLKRCRITQKQFDFSECRWSELVKIHDDYLKHKELLEGVAQSILNKFLTTDAKEAGVHSVRFRLKKAESLIEKIIRKKIEAKKDGKRRVITLKNYMEQINDLIGIRILHAFKDDWFSIHDYIINQCCYSTKGRPMAYHRKGDEKDYIIECKNRGCETKVHPKAYRSIHYIIDPHPSKKNWLC